MKTKLLITILALSCLHFALEAQEIPPYDSIPAPVLDTLGQPVLADSNKLVIDSLFQPKDSLVLLNSSPTIAFSKDSLEQEVESFGHDSMRYDIANKLIHLWGDAYVIYGDITLKADYIVYNWTDNIVTAEYSEDSLGHKKGQPEFTDKDQTFSANKMRYNFKTGKGVVIDAVSTYNGMYVLGGKAKIFGEGSDSTHTDQHIYSKDAIFTTCNHPHPHFGIRSRKQKVVPNKVVIVGPSNLEIGGVPTPVWLPFGFFPLKTGERTGLLFGDYEYSEQFGFGLRNFGWYFPINDYINLTVRGDIYSRGTWRLRTHSDYKKMYKYSGSLDLSFADLKVERGIETVSDRAFKINWRHTQDTKAHPTMSFGGSVEIQTNDFQSRIETDVDKQFENTLRSNLNFTKKFPNKPYTFTASFEHSQNTLNRKVTVTLPNLTFRTGTVYPFRSKKKNTGNKEERWYEKISLSYDGRATNQFSATDTTLFTQQTLDDARFGAKHEVKTNVDFTLFKYFNLRPNVGYTEVWHFKTLNKTFDPTPVVDTVYNDEGAIDHLDTTSFGTVQDMTDVGFRPLRLFTTGASLSTKLFGLLQFKRGWLRGLRHTATPSISINYIPDYTTDFWNYFKEVQTSTEDEELDQYSIFRGGVYSNQPSPNGKQMKLNYGLSNIFEGKYFSRKDSTFQKFKIFDNISIRGDYDFAKDTLKFSTIKAGTTAKLIPNGISNLTLSAVFDPYIIENGDQVNKFVWNENRKLFRFASATAGVSTRFNVKQIVSLLSGKGLQGGSGSRPKKDAGPKGLANETLISLIDNFSLNHQFRVSLTRIGEGANQRDTLAVTAHTLTLRGDLQLTDKWRLSISQISYNFKLKKLVFPQLGFFRDLHCWEMGVSWTPAFNTFSFNLNVKPGALDFIKVPYGRNQYDGSELNRF